MTIGIKFCGGARTVTGSIHLVFTDTSNILLDCGLFHGHRDDYYLINSNFSFDPQGLDSVVLSHAHVDHCGNIPTLIKKGYRGPIYCTPTTRDLCRFMLPDSGFIQEEDIKYVNKVNKRRGLPPRFPLYTKSDAEKALKYFRTLEYHKSLALTKDANLTFYESGHILGSTIPTIDVKTKKGNTRISYAVDLGRKDMPLLRNPEIPKSVNYLIIESTYGSRKHDSIKDAEGRLSSAINKTINRGGKVIIPAFALERTQLIVYFINQLMKNKKIANVPIYVDGPLAVNLTNVFRKNWEYFDDATVKKFLGKEDPLGYKNVVYINNVNESKKLNDVTKPVIIISGSGMCENGRILHHLKNSVENPKNSLILIGYMAKDTLGRRISEKEKEVRIFGRPYELRAEVIIVNAFSSHADRDGLLEYVSMCMDSLKGVFIVHGEPKESELLRDAIRSKLNIKPRIPARDEIIFLRT